MGKNTYVGKAKATFSKGQGQGGSLRDSHDCGRGDTSRPVGPHSERTRWQTRPVSVRSPGELRVAPCTETTYLKTTSHNFVSENGHMGKTKSRIDWK